MGGWDYFRTFRWVSSIENPSVLLKEIRELVEI
jgi:hypothetical protein